MGTESKRQNNQVLLAAAATLAALASLTAAVSLSHLAATLATGLLGIVVSLAVLLKCGGRPEVSRGHRNWRLEGKSREKSVDVKKECEV